MNRVAVGPLLSLALTVWPLRAQVVNDGASATLVNVTNTIPGTVTVGTNGSFTSLVLSDNALLANSVNGVIGRNSTAKSNEVRLVSATARWQMGASLFVGSNGSFNRLVLSNGAQVGNSDGFIGIGAAGSNNEVVATGSGSFWTNRAHLYLGEFGSSGNRLVISNGARVDNNIGFVGFAPSSTNNSVLVTGAGSAWGNRSSLAVGQSGSGSLLTIRDGGQAFSLDGYVGIFSPNNQAVVTGAGSHWTNQTDYYVGFNGAENRLRIENGGLVVNGNGHVGFGASSSNNLALVTGSGSLWSNRANLFVGESGSGNQVIVSHGGSASAAGSAVLGFLAGANSNAAVVADPGSSWWVGNSLFVGSNGSFASLVISNGAQVRAHSAQIGRLSGSGTNLVVVTGSGSTWSNVGFGTALTVGLSSSGNQLLVRDGGRVMNPNGSASIGNVGFNNLARVTGPGSIWSNAFDLNIGVNLVGNVNNRLFVEDGGAVFNGDASIGGSGSGSTNSAAVVSGSGSLWRNGNLRVGGGDGRCALVVSNGGTVLARVGLVGGTAASHFNRAVVTGLGSLWSNQADVAVGPSSARNSLVLSNGGALINSNGHVGGFLVSDTAAHSNTVVVTGAGSTWENRAGLSIGVAGRANQLTVTNGGTVTASNVFLGFHSTSTDNRLTVGGGTVRAGLLDVRRGTNVFLAGLVDADRLLLTNTAGRFEFLGGTLVTRGAFINNSEMRIGDTSAGSAAWDVRPGASNHFVALGVIVGNASPSNSLRVSGGALLTNSMAGSIGSGVGADANTATVTGPGSRWQVAGDVSTGLGGAFNRLTVSDGGRVDATSGRLGVSSPASSNNLALVTGAGSIWSNAASVIVGDVGRGNQLQIRGGGLVVAGSGSVGQSATANANTAQITDTGSEWRFASSFNVGSSGSFNRLLISDGGRVSDFSSIIGGTPTGSNNAAEISGPGSTWTHASDFTVGLFGQGSQLVVSNGGLIVANFGGVGDSGADNQAVVTGSGSAWSNTAALHVGYFGNSNRLVVKSGGLLVSDLGSIGETGRSNEVTVTGAGSLWHNRLDLAVGVSGLRNQLLVSDGGTARVGGDARIGGNNVARSNAIVTAGPGARWLVTSNLYVGDFGSFNRLVVSNGGFVGANVGSVGFESTASNNVALVTGLGSVFSNASGLLVGTFGSGNQLVVSNGGSVVSGESVVGVNIGSDGNLAVVTGPGSAWNLTDNLFVGLFGNANRLLVNNAGRVFNEFGSLSSRSNEVIITGTGSLWSNRLDVVVGFSGGANRLEVNNGGTVSGRNVLVGQLDTSTNNRVVVNGGTLRATNGAGTGVLRVQRGTNVLNAGVVDVDQLAVTTPGIGMPSEFGNGSSIIIPSDGVALVYPSTIAVSGLVGAVTKVTVTLSNLSFPDSAPADLDILLVSPAGQKVMLMSDAGGNSGLSNLRLDFDDTAASMLPSPTMITSGTYRPTDFEPGETLPSPAPLGPYSTALSSINGSNPNGVWSLYISDDTSSFSGTSFVGWGVKISTDGGLLRESGVFELNGGTLITRGTVIHNGLPFIVGGPGGVPAVWEARAGLSDNVVARDLLVGNNSSLNQLVIPSGVVSAGTNVIVGASPSVSTNNLLHVNGGTLRVVTPGAMLDIRGGTNRLDAGLVDVNRLVITNTRGQFELNGGTLRTPDTTVANGRVFTVGGGANTTTLQLLGGRHTFANNLTVATNGSLIGTGVMDGTVTVAAGGRLTPGAPIGRIDVLGSVILQGAVNLQIDKSGGVRTHDQVTASGAIFYNGTLNVTDIGTDLLAAGDRFFLFDATPYVGAFTTLNLPPLGPGLAWRNNLSVDGSIEVTSAVVSMPGFSAIARSGTNVVFTGTNGAPNGTYTVLASTNVALPLSNWLSLATSQFNATGGFAFTNAIPPGIPQRFFRLRSP